MRKKLIIPVIVMSLLLAGCSDRNSSPKKPKVFVPYSALVKDESSSPETQPSIDSQPTEDNSITSEENDSNDNNSISIEPNGEDNPIDYDALTEAIADKVAEKIAEKLEKEQTESNNGLQESTPNVSPSQNENNNFQPPNDQNQYGANGFTTTAKDPTGYQQGVSIPQNQGNKQTVSELNQAISTYKDEISLYQIGIDELNAAIAELDDIQTKCEDNLKKANVELANAQKKTTWVYGTNGFKQVLDQGAISNAQKEVDTYESLIAECKSTREDARSKLNNMK